MYKKHLLLNIEREIILLKQLSPMIEEKDLDFRPAEKMRSTYELMQYLSNIGAVILRWFIDNDITPEVRKEIADHRSTLTIQNFPDRIDEQWTVIQSYINAISEEELMTREIELPWKEKMVLGAAIMNAPVKWLASYRMQLFMHLKMNGRPEIGTKDAWVPKALQA
jgi:hypothetical protein